MSKNIFITATGTDIGKTYISALIIKAMREAGYNCGYFKPVLSGVVVKNGVLAESDCNYVVNTAKIPVKADDCVAYYWEEAVSPHLAAHRANQKIDVKKIKQTFFRIQNDFEYVLIEGAGGITCPLIMEEHSNFLMKDLINELNVSIIVVADGGLGTINSTLLTTKYAEANNIKIEGIILNNFNSDSFMHQDNLKQVETLTGINVIATVEKNQKEIKLLKDIFK